MNECRAYSRETLLNIFALICGTSLGSMPKQVRHLMRQIWYIKSNFSNSNQQLVSKRVSGKFSL